MQSFPTVRNLPISDETGRLIRRMDLEKGAGLRRVAWNLRTDPPAAPAPGTPAAAAAGRGGPGGRGGRGANLPPLVQPGRYRATLGRMVGDIVTPIGSPQSFGVVQVQQ